MHGTTESTPRQGCALAGPRHALQEAQRQHHGPESGCAWWEVSTWWNDGRERRANDGEMAEVCTL